MCTINLITPPVPFLICLLLFSIPFSDSWFLVLLFDSFCLIRATCVTTGLGLSIEAWWDDQGLHDWTLCFPLSLNLPETSSSVVKGRALSPAFMHAWLLLGPRGVDLWVSHPCMPDCWLASEGVELWVLPRCMPDSWLVHSCTDSAQASIAALSLWHNGWVLQRRCYFTSLLISRLSHSLCLLFHNVPLERTIHMTWVGFVDISTAQVIFSPGLWFFIKSIPYTGNMEG